MFFICNIEAIDIATMGVCAITSHAKKNQTPRKSQEF